MTFLRNYFSLTIEGKLEMVEPHELHFLPLERKLLEQEVIPNADHLL
jgi:hypothetical protein